MSSSHVIEKVNHLMYYDVRPLPPHRYVWKVMYGSQPYVPIRVSFLLYKVGRTEQGSMAIISYAPCGCRTNCIVMVENMSSGRGMDVMPLWTVFQNQTGVCVDQYGVIKKGAIGATNKCIQWKQSVEIPTCSTSL